MSKNIFLQEKFMTRYAFVIMPFAEEFTDIYESGIKSVAAECDVRTERLDEQIYDNDMLEQIYKEIDRCDFVIADMTARNPNVFYEVGYADAKKKLIILLTQNSSDIPFDLKHRPHVVYEGSIKKLKEELKSRIEWANSEIDKRKKDPIKMSIKVKSCSVHEKDDTDTAILNYVCEIQNMSDSKIKGLGLIYLYTGPAWVFFKDEKQLKQSKSDITPFATRHLINPEMNIIPQNDVYTFEVTGKKIVYEEWLNEGDGRKDEYKLFGTIIMLVHTDQNSYRSDVVLETLAKKESDFSDEIPF